MVKGVVFDFDGTLITIEERLYNVMKDCSKKYGIESFLDYEDYLPYFRSARLDGILAKIGLPKEKKLSYWNDFLLSYRQEKYWVFSELNEGAREFLTKLKKEKFRLAVITGGIAKQEDFKKELASFGIEKFFEIAYPNPVSNKMDSEYRKSPQLREVMEKWGMGPEETMFFGDYLADIKTAREVGTKFILVGKENSFELESGMRLGSLSEAININFREI